jgi:peptide/nickel transport system substrate-binding protein
MERSRVIVLALAAILATMAAPAWAENVVRWVSATGMSTWEPTKATALVLNGRAQVYEGLTLLDADLSLRPALATAWTLVRPDTWRFELRRSVRFHDGSPLTVEDVAFSLDRAHGEGSEYAYLLTSIAAVTATGEHEVEITTRQPDLLLPVKLKSLAIISRVWAERHGAELPARPADATAHTYTHANGTGPFVLESFEPVSKRAVLVRNPRWWGLERYPHNIDRIVWTPEPDPERRLALLLDGEAELLQDPPLDRLDRLRGVAGIKLARAGALITVFLCPDQGSAELRTSDVKGRNPFADRRVRQALYHAIDVEALIRKALGGFAVPIGMVAPPGINGHDPELDRRLPHNPERAKALLAGAGYPDGFAVRLDCPDHRREACRELAAQLALVGIRVTVDTVLPEQFEARLKARGSDLYLFSDQATITMDSAELFHDLFYSPPAFYGGAIGYADPAMNALIDQIDGEISSPIRDVLIERAWRTVLDDVVVVPLYRPLLVWAMRDTLEVPASSLGRPHFHQARVTSPPARTR